MEQNKILEYGDIDLLYEYLQRINIYDEDKYWCSTKENSLTGNKINLRRRIFDYATIAYAKLVNNKIEEIILFDTPQYGSSAITIEVKMFTLGNKEFIEEAINYIKKEFEYRGWEKMFLEIVELQKNKKLINFIELCGFSEEIKIPTNDYEFMISRYSAFLGGR